MGRILLTNPMQRRFSNNAITDYTSLLIQRGGGTGPMKPRQPGRNRPRCQCRQKKFWTMRGRPSMTLTGLSVYSERPVFCCPLLAPSRRR